MNCCNKTQYWKNQDKDFEIMAIDPDNQNITQQ